MLLFAAFAVGWVTEPVQFVRAPLLKQPRFVQLVSLTVNVTPPPPGAPYSVVCTLQNDRGNIAYYGTLPGGATAPIQAGRLIVVPWTAQGFNPSQPTCRVNFIPPQTFADCGGAILLHNAGAGISAGPGAIPGSAISGYSFTVGP